MLHVVLFRPKPDVTDADRDAFLDALRAAAQSIPSVRRFRLGRRILPETGDEPGMPAFPYSAVIEFDDRSGLQEYLQHPQHAKVGTLFQELQDAALVYDFEVFGEY